MTDTNAPHSNLNGQRLTTARVTIPYSGAWVADVTLAEASTLTPTAVLSIGNLTLVGTVVRTASYTGSRSARIVGGAAGWRKGVTRRQYASASGVSLAMVLRDAALEVGERVTVTTDRSLGAHFIRSEGLASRLLRELAPDWWVDPLGVTQVGPRISLPIASAFTVISYEGGKGRFTVATESPLDWLPGRTFTSPTVTTPVTVGSATHYVDNEGVSRVEVMALRDTTVTRDPLTAAVLDILRGEFPQLDYLGRHEYIVQAVTGTASVSARPVDASDNLPDIVGAPMLPGILGEQVTPVVGSKCLVEFIAGDPSKPIVTGGDLANPPTLAKLAGGGNGVARTNDAVNGGTVTALGVAVGAPIEFIYTPVGGVPGAPSATLLLTGGKVTGGSTKVTCG